MIPNTPEGQKVQVDEFSEAEQLTGSLSFQHLEDKFMHSVMENDKDVIDEGKLLQDAVNYNTGTFNPDIMFEKLTQNYSLAKQIYGESIIRLVSGYDSGFVNRNIKIPEFQRELKDKITEKVKQLKDQGLLTRSGEISEKGLELASLVSYVQELDKLEASGYRGETPHKKRSMYGDTYDTTNYKKGSRYRDISIKSSLKQAIRRGRKELDTHDLKIKRRESKGKVSIVYALDASGSMKGKKIASCKRAGIALAYKAIQNKDNVGLIVFGSDIKTTVEPTTDFSRLLHEITKIKATKETDFKATIRKAIELFPTRDETKHLVLLTDALPTKGSKPHEEALEQATLAKEAGVTISLIGINLDEKGKEFAEKIVEVGEGRMHVVRDLAHVDSIILEDYYAVR